MKHFKHRFQHLIDYKNLTPASFAKQFGCNISQVTRWKKAKDTPHEGTVIRLVTFFKCSRSWLETGTGEPFPGKNNSTTTTTVDNSRWQTAKNGSTIENSGGNMKKNYGQKENLQLSALERAAIEMNREKGGDKELLDFMNTLSNKSE